MNANERLGLIHAANSGLEQGLKLSIDAANALRQHAIAFYIDTNQHEQVKGFMKAFGQAIPDEPTFDFPVDLRLNLIEEELDELKQAIVDQDMVEFVDAICDLLYVVHGAALAAGIHHIQPFFEEVHRSNMDKLNGPIREDGKQLKPEGWQPPRIKELLEERYGQGVCSNEQTQA